MTSKRKLLILTAGRWQLPVIQKARELGLHVVVTDQNPHAPGLGLADACEIVSCQDLEATLAVARKHAVDGVIAEQTDVAVVTAAYVAERMGLPGIGMEAARRATNKFLMREACRSAGVPVPEYRRAVTEKEAIRASEAIGLPVIVKPTDGQSSRGVAKIWQLHDVPERFLRAQAASREGVVLVEELLSGAESSAEAIRIDGKLHLLGICEKTKSPPPFPYDVRLVYPATFSTAVMREIAEVNERVVAALGIPFGITHGEYIVTGKGVYLLELAARGCGAGVASQLIPAMTGFDVIGARIKQALGEPVTPMTITPRHGILEFLLLPAGRIRSIRGVDEARRLPGAVAADYLLQPGDIVGTIENGAQRPGYLLGVGDSRDDVLRLVERAKELLHVDMEPAAS